MFQCTFCTEYYDEAVTCCGHVTPDVRTFVTLFESTPRIPVIRTVDDVLASFKGHNKEALPAQVAAWRAIGVDDEDIIERLFSIWEEDFLPELMEE